MLGHGEISPAGLALISVLLGVSVCGAFSVSPIRSAGGASAPGWRSSRFGGDTAVDLDEEFYRLPFWARYYRVCMRRGRGGS